MNGRWSHKIWLLGALMVPLAGCNGGVSGLTPASYQDAYRISLTSLGYSATGRGTSDSPRLYKIPSVTATLVATSGAPDVRDVTYTATLLNSNGEPATGDNSSIAPAKGTLFAGAKGGYICATTAEAACTISSEDARWATNGSWTVNKVERAIVPIEWAVAQDNATTGEGAQWYAEFSYTAHMANGQNASWKQRYQFVSPNGPS
ncbi:hypothetical protein DKM44_13070 [Deinococcus irradiatisoli]|uniref:Lipoprotein n=1 Tax=Deinococcus irradiatisoli TaxID=2202254 RepID=A0A2Z3JG92_9DEIO|nr:hypothetical protein [Deinococcus irradiatisoli]AWN24052.1 hypothetical protein DKM44_13070 [Deinococcus irradiatisoli]